jgi:hypothetical protein
VFIVFSFGLLESIEDSIESAVLSSSSIFIPTRFELDDNFDLVLARFCDDVDAPRLELLFDVMYLDKLVESDEDEDE